MTGEQFAAQLLGTHTPGVAVEWSNLDRIGKRLETKTETVLVDARLEREAAAKKAIRPFEVDGWVGNAMDAMNHHRRLGKGVCPSDDTADGVIGDAYRVTFSRYVEDK